MEQEVRQCQNCKKDFAIELEDFAFYERIKVPPPTFCPDCRFKRRLAWRNGRLLFRRKDDSSGKDIFSGFPPTSEIKVYDQEYWKSDAWDPIEYGREYDFSRSFFEQYIDLLHSVPWPSKSVQGMVNSDYCDQAGFFKNSYLCFNGDRVEDSAYTTQCTDVKFCFDCSLSHENELCYECVSVNGSYKTIFSQDCENCVDVKFSKNCTSCNNCFGCMNLKGKSYHFLNQELSKEEYEEKISDLKLDTEDGITNATELTSEFFKKYPHKYYRGFRITNSNGDYLRNVKNVKESYFVDDAEDSKFTYNTYLSTKDCYDYSAWGNKATLLYECSTCGDQCNSMRFCIESWPGCKDLDYCAFCRSCSDCFGCVSLKKKQYCIFNKQYSREEYEKLRGEIIKQMAEKPYVNPKGQEYRYGEFLPAEFSHYAYNETVLQEIFPLSREEALEKKLSWRDPDIKEYETTISSEDLPDINSAGEEILKEVIQCEICKKAYRIIDPELNFLKKMGLPLPRACLGCRAAHRALLVNPPIYHKRQCQCAGESSENGIYANAGIHDHSGKCPVEFETSYSPDRSEIVYCESCYQSEVA